MIMTILLSAFASAAPAQPAPTPYQVCVQTCIAYADQPGFELRRCIERCAQQERQKTLRLNNQEQGRRWCETYEDDCERPGTGI